MATGSESNRGGGNSKGSKIASSTAASRRGKKNEMPFSMPKAGEVVPF